MNTGNFVCCICNKHFSRRNTIFNVHFSGCVRQHGNPNNLPWDHHPSCRADGRRGLSGRVPLGYDKANKLYLNDWPGEAQSEERKAEDEVNVDGGATFSDGDGDGDGDDATSFDDHDSEDTTSNKSDNIKVSTKKKKKLKSPKCLLTCCDASRSSLCVPLLTTLRPCLQYLMSGALLDEDVDANAPDANAPDGPYYLPRRPRNHSDHGSYPSLGESPEPETDHQSLNRTIRGEGNLPSLGNSNIDPRLLDDELEGGLSYGRSRESRGHDVSQRLQKVPAALMEKPLTVTLTAPKCQQNIQRNLQIQL